MISLEPSGYICFSTIRRNYVDIGTERDIFYLKKNMIYDIDETKSVEFEQIEKKEETKDFFARIRNTEIIFEDNIYKEIELQNKPILSLILSNLMKKRKAIQKLIKKNITKSKSNLIILPFFQFFFFFLMEILISFDLWT